MQILLTLVIFFVIIGLLIFVHELGHFLAARLSEVKVNEFALGFGPVVWSREIRGTHYKLNLIPLGGYVQLHGERGAEEGKTDKDPHSFRNKSIWAKAFILLAGIFMNIVTAFVLATVYMNLSNYQASLVKVVEYPFQAERVEYGIRVLEVYADTPAVGKINPNEMILELNGQVVTEPEKFSQQIKDNANKQITLKIKDLLTNQIREITLELKDKLGIGYDTVYILNYSQNILAGTRYALDMFGYQIAGLGKSISDSISSRNIAPVSNNVGSIAAVGVIVNSYVQQGQFSEIINITIAVSLALAFFNLLPIPVLDGGQLLIEVIESALRRKLPERVTNALFIGSFGFLIILSVLILLKDIVYFNIFNDLINTIKSVLGR